MQLRTAGVKAIGGLLLAAAGSLGLAATANAQDTIKIAYMEPMSGPLANVGDAGLRHFRYKAEQMNKAGGILGKQIEIVPFDNKASPQESLVILRQIADQGISYLIQGQGSHVAGALISALDKHNQRNPNKILYLNYAAVDPTLTEEQCSFWHFRIDANSEMKLEALTSYMAQSPDIQKVFLINMDYAHGHQIEKITKRLLPQKNPNIQIFATALHPIGRVKDFTPYISQIRASGADSVITGNWGNDLSLLVKAASDTGLNVKFYTYYGGGLGGPKTIGAAGEGRLFQITEYHRNLPLEKGKLEVYDFVLPFDKANGDIDWYFERAGTLMDMLKAAMEQAKSTDTTKVAFALEGMHIKTPYGDATMRAIDHQLLQPLYISMLTKNVKYDAENSGLGFKTIAEAMAEETAAPTSCQMKRPRR
jgi:branched-chain amino acid transport system substrate-binding protein